MTYAQPGIPIALKPSKHHLIEGGFSLSDTVRVQYTLTHLQIWLTMLAPVLEKYMGNIRPAATMVIAKHD